MMIYHKWRHFTSSHNVIIHKIRNWLQNIDLKTSKSFHRQNLRKYDSRKLLVEWRNLLVLDHIRRIFDQHQRRPLLEWLRQRNHVISLYTPGIKNVFDHKLWCLKNLPLLLCHYCSNHDFAKQVGNSLESIRTNLTIQSNPGTFDWLSDIFSVLTINIIEFAANNRPEQWHMVLHQVLHNNLDHHPVELKLSNNDRISRLLFGRPVHWTLNIAYQFDGGIFYQVDLNSHKQSQTIGWQHCPIALLFHWKLLFDLLELHLLPLDNRAKFHINFLQNHLFFRFESF